MYSARDVSSYIINWCNDRNIGITNLKLQKLLYFIQGEMIKYTKKQFISDDFYAWKLGPVIPEIYKDYSIYTSTLIPKQNEKIQFNENELILLDSIIKKYAYKSSWELVDLSHKEDPWKYNYEIFGDKSKIPFKSIADYYWDGEN